MFDYKMCFLNISALVIVKCIGLAPLATLRRYFDIVFIYKLINSMINCSEFPSQMVLEFLRSILDIKPVLMFPTLLKVM